MNGLTTYVSSNVTTPISKELLEYCEKELVVINPEYIAKERMNLWLGNTPKMLRLYETRGTNLILPFGCLAKIWDIIKDQDIICDFANDEIQISGEVPLYDYQEEAVQKALRFKNGVLVSAAGSGKTQMGIEVIRRIGKKALWITHTKDLLDQSKKRAEAYLKCSLGTITEGKVNIQDITFATVQTLCKMDMASLKKEFSVVIVDECHRVASTPTKLTMFGKVINSLAARYKIGLTATAHRADGMIKSLYALLGDVFYEVTKDKTADKTVKAIIKPIETGFRIGEWSEAYDTDGTIIFAKLINEICESERRNELLARYIIKDKSESCLVLSDRLEQLRELKSLVGYGVMIDGTMTSKTGKASREKAIEDMRTGKETLLFASYNLAKEGLDIPRLTRLFLASPKKDYAVIVQSVGRIERKVDGKEPGIVYDFVDDIGACEAMFKARKSHYRRNGNSC